MSVAILDCGHIPSPSGGGVGYGKDANGKTHCYECCAENHRAEMEALPVGGVYGLYLIMDKDVNASGWAYDGMTVTNWPGTLTIKVLSCKKGRHNIAGVRYDFWFAFAGHRWHGVCIGDNTQLSRCTKLKARAES